MTKQFVFLLTILLSLQSADLAASETPVSPQLPQTIETHVTIAGLTVHCIEPAGTNKTQPADQKTAIPLVLIGGGPAFSTWHLKPVQQELAKQRRVCRWDMRGVGDNSKDKTKDNTKGNVKANTNAFVSDIALAGTGASASIRLNRWLEDMHRVIRHLSAHGPVILWGHSWGALQIQLYAQRYAEWPLYLILSNPVDPALSSMQNLHHKLYQHPELDGKLSLENIDTADESELAFRLKIASYFSNADKGWAYAQRFTSKDSNDALNVAIWEDYRRSGYTIRDLVALRSKIAGLIHCRGDVLQPESLAVYRDALPLARHHVLTGCGHFPWVEQPQHYFDALKQLIHGVVEAF